jgi:hypothetical protein
MTEKKDKNFYMRMPRALFDQIRYTAQLEGTSVSEFVRQLILTSGRLLHPAPMVATDPPKHTPTMN